MTTPTVGRIVHYFPGELDTDAQSNGNGANDPVAAVVTRVWSDTCVNLLVLLDDDEPVTRTSVPNGGDDGQRWEHIEA